MLVIYNKKLPDNIGDCFMAQHYALIKRTFMCINTILYVLFIVFCSGLTVEDAVKCFGEINYHW